jgi:hypothetical protein
MLSEVADGINMPLNMESERVTTVLCSQTVSHSGKQKLATNDSSVFAWHLSREEVYKLIQFRAASTVSKSEVKAIPSWKHASLLG